MLRLRCPYMLRLRVHTCSGKGSIHAQVKSPYMLRLRVHTCSG